MRLNYIGTEHLLLGLLHEGDGPAAGVLIDKCGLKLDMARELVLQILKEASTIALPEIPEQAATLLGENEQGATCGRCGAHSPDYFRYCFHCGLKLS
ncbi:MAG TPA: Clp protease N-terminal domain-containing protein [Ktedonobacteraceae bacterium]